MIAPRLRGARRDVNMKRVLEFGEVPEKRVEDLGFIIDANNGKRCHE